MKFEDIKKLHQKKFREQFDKLTLDSKDATRKRLASKAPTANGMPRFTA